MEGGTKAVSTQSQTFEVPHFIATFRSLSLPKKTTLRKTRLLHMLGLVAMHQLLHITFFPFAGKVMICVMEGFTNLQNTVVYEIRNRWLYKAI